MKQNKVSSNFVQDYSAPEKAQARANIDAASTATATVSDPGLMSVADKVKLDSIESGAQANVQANWAQTDADAPSYIQNKPSLATVATSGDYGDLINRPTIPPALSAGTGISIVNDLISRRVQLVSTSHSYAYVRSIIDAGDLPVLDKANGSMHDLFVCTMYRGSDIQFVGAAYGQPTLYNLASNNTWTSQILKPQILQANAGKYLAINAAGTDAEWQAVRQVPTYAVADTYKFLGVVNNGGTVQLAWTVPGGYWTSSTSIAQSHDITAEDISAGYFDLYMQVTATDTSTTLYDTPAFFALSWDVQWHTQGNPGNLDSLTFAAGVDGGSYVDLFSDTSPAHAVHKDWGITKAWSAGNRYNRIRVRFALNSTTQVGDGFMLYAGGIVNQVRG